MPTGRPLNAKLFLECKEVPFIGATATFSVDQAAIAYVDLVPHKSINQIKPRTLVHLFVQDFNNPAANFPYILFFQGEVFGFTFGKAPDSRTFSISCIDHSSYWDNVLLYFFNAQQSLGMGCESVAATGQDMIDNQKEGIKNISTTSSISSYFISIVKSVLGQKDGTRQKDFLDALVQVYKNIGQINDFYSLSQDRLRVLDRIRLKSSGQLESLLESNQAIEWFSGIIGRNSGYSTLRGVVQDLMGIIFHDFSISVR